MSNLSTWLSKAGYPGDGGSQHALGQSGSGKDMGAGKVDQPKLSGMHEGAHDEEAGDDDTGLKKPLDKTSRTGFDPAPEGSNAVRGEEITKGAGEGSRGGNITGHTSSGKPIYGHSNGGDNSAAHKEFSAKDHSDAMTHHLSHWAMSQSKHKRKEASPKELESGNDHHKMAAHHAGQSLKKEGKFSRDAQRELLGQHEAQHEGASSGKWGKMTTTEASRAGQEKHIRGLNKGLSAPPVEKDPTEEDPNADDEPTDEDIEKSFLFGYDDMITGDTLEKGGPYIGTRGGKWADPDHKIPWSDKKHSGKPSPKAKEANSEGSRELTLHAENNASLYTRQHEPIRNNLSRKMAAGTYDHAQATKLYGHMMESASKDYSKEFGGGSGAGGHHFDPATRSLSAKQFADQFHEEAMAGDHDHRVPKKHKGKGLKELSEGSMAKATQGLAALGDWLVKGGNLQHTNAISPATKGKASPTGSGPSGSYTRGDTNTNGKANLKCDEELSNLEGDAKEQKLKGSASGATSGAPGLGENRENSDINGKRRLAKSLHDILGREPTWQELEKAMSGGLYAGEPKEMDERRDMGSGGAEVGRAEDGGKVAGQGANAGIPPQGQTPDNTAGKVDNGKLSRLSDDDPKDTDEMKSNRAMQEQRADSVSGGLGADKKDGAINKAFDPNQRYPTDYEQLEAEREYAQRVRLHKAGEPDVQVNVASAQISADPDVQRVAVMVKGGVLYTDESDQRAAAIAKGDSFYADGSPSIGLDARGQLRKSVGCPSCGHATPAFLGSCQSCGNGLLSKGEAEPQVLQHGSRQGPALRPLPGADLFLPNGVTND